MRALDDPDNPYRDEYRAWDFWLYHQAEVTEEQSLNPYLQFNRPNNWQSLRGTVDESGFLVPQLRMVSDEFYSAASEEGLAEQAPCHHSLFGEGEMDPAMLMGLRWEQASVKAAYLAPVPLWLAQAAPQWAMLMPDGEVVTYGPRNLDDVVWDEVAPGEPFNPKAVYFRYSQQGLLLRQGKLGHYWWELYFEGFDELVRNKNGIERWFILEENGYIYFYHQETNKLERLYNYDGTQLPTSQPPPVRPGHQLVWLNSGELPLLYDVQQRQTGFST